MVDFFDDEEDLYDDYDYEEETVEDFVDENLYFDFYYDETGDEYEEDEI